MKNHNSLLSLMALSLLVFLISDIQGGIGSILTIYLRSEVGCTTSQISIALAAMGISSAIFLIPCGFLVDATKYKRTLIAIGCGCVALSRLIISIHPTYYPILAAQFLFGIAYSIFLLAIPAITLGLVGKRRFPKRAALNEMLYHAGTIFIILTMGIVTQLYTYHWIIYLTIFFALIALIPLYLIRPKEIDHKEARAASTSKSHPPIAISKLLTKKSILLFYTAFIIYQIATASLLPLVGQKLGEIDPQHDAINMASCIVLAQIVMVAVALLLRVILGAIGRKPIFICGFVFILLRAILFSVTDNTYYILSIQLLDGVASGIFGVISIIIVSDLAAGTGRFNFLVGLLGVCNCLGLALSNFISGFITQQFGFSAGFISLAFISLFGVVFSVFALPETKKSSSHHLKLIRLKYLFR